MKCTLFLPFYGDNSLNFDCAADYYKGSSYADALAKGVEESKNAVMMLNGASYDKVNSITFAEVEKMMHPIGKSEEKEELSSCECYIFNELNCPETVDSMIGYNLSGDVFILLVKFDFNTMEEEFEEDFKVWLESSKKISTCGGNDDWIFANLPKRNFKFQFINKFGGDTFGELVGCKFLQTTNEGKYVILVENLIFLKEL